MDTKMIGSFLKDLRKERGFTQEQLAEQLGVSNRTVSRWETGSNLPDFDVLLELARYYNVTVDEILQGRRIECPFENNEKTMDNVAEYTHAVQAQLNRLMFCYFMMGLFGIALFLFLEFSGLRGTEFIGPFLGIHVYDSTAGMGIGLAISALIIGALFTGPAGEKLRAWKMKQFKKINR